MSWVNVGIAGANLLGGVLGGKKGLDSLEQGRNDILGLPGQDPLTLAGSFGASSGETGISSVNPQLLQAQEGLSGAIPGLFGGGLASNAGVQNAVGQAGNQLAPSFSNLQNVLGQQAGGQAFGGLQGLFGQSNALGNVFANNVAAGPQDFSRGAFGNLLSGGQNLLGQAGNTSGLVQQNLDASRALAQPFENNLINQFSNREFMNTRGATSGSERRQGLLQTQLLNADNQRVLNAQGLGLQSQNQLGQLGLGQLGQAQGFLGQNLGQFNTNAGLASQFMGQAGQFEGQGFGQALSALQQNQSAGQARLASAQNLLGFGDQLFGNSFGRGLSATEGLLGIGQQGLDVAALPFELQAGLLGAGGAHAGALRDMSTANASSQSGLFGGLASGIGDVIGGLFG